MSLFWQLHDSFVTTIMRTHKLFAEGGGGGPGLFSLYLVILSQAQTNDQLSILPGSFIEKKKKANDEANKKRKKGKATRQKRPDRVGGGVSE